VNALPKERSQTEALECEFIPTLDTPDAWGPPWDRQLSLVLAWQEAGGNSDGEAGQYKEPTADMIVPPLEQGGTARDPAYGGGGGGQPELTMRTIVRMNTLLVSLRERMLQITTEASNVAIAEMALRQGSAAGVSDPSASLQALSQENAQRIAQLARSWFDIIAAAQAGMNSLTGVTARGAASGEAPVASGGGRRIAERRRREAMIDFPDRRMAA
jgi:hypothetical protein